MPGAGRRRPGFTSCACTRPRAIASGGWRCCPDILAEKLRANPPPGPRVRVDRLGERRTGGLPGVDVLLWRARSVDADRGSRLARGHDVLDPSLRPRAWAV